MKATQKAAVFAAITSVLAEAGHQYEEGMDVGPIMTRELRAQVNQILFEGFRAGSIELDKEFDDTELKSYVSGLQSNWIRKDKRLNGNVTYVAKNPGSRAGSGDPTLKAMRNLLTTLTDANDKAEVQACIDEHVSKIQASKVKVIDYTKLPANLAAKFAGKRDQ